MSIENLALSIMCPNEIGLADIKCNDGDNCLKCTYEWLKEEENEL